MFHQLSLFALVAPLVSGLVLEIPQNPTSGGQITIKWTNQQGDPSTWSVELTNQAFNDDFAIANNVDPSQNSLVLTLPIVPVGDGYTLQAVNIGNVTDIFASTGDFAIGAATTSISSSASTSALNSATSKSATGSNSGTSSVSATAASSTNTTPGFSSVIVTSQTTSPTASTGTNSSASTSGTATNPAATTSSAALSSRMGASAPFGGLAAVVLSAVAGAAMIAL